jgi:hypothetical protein
MRLSGLQPRQPGLQLADETAQADAHIPKAELRMRRLQHWIIGYEAVTDAAWPEPFQRDLLGYPTDGLTVQTAPAHAAVKELGGRETPLSETAPARAAAEMRLGGSAAAPLHAAAAMGLGCETVPSRAAAEMGLRGSEAAPAHAAAEMGLGSETVPWGAEIRRLRARTFWGPPAVVEDELPRLYRDRTGIYLGRRSVQGVTKLEWVTICGPIQVASSLISLGLCVDAFTGLPR